ncbi:hypothetical protein GE21DRAFT_3648 [Neurospora crassa]|uniref:Bromodomain protein-3 n=1 Tax=Neurospora crassa (strain ATCC 24698 / 74-OR23-1A / CBS 708.71 / DSM 1257 / FGSC 987) TaxID=367110 RepID=V5IPQ4_NEUCR|nr:bromodomain protein-3 [Neurospora crassa OR74A]XP_011393610.1 bromodomain protein-3, variant [Neurospora crassa OR74A]ESA43715.1 bromodomain protein-3 [Neurospora crassa OR74A]ESA43716.1 bromodomain protein-3, variant [Neurospora crassa OR74A]KHE82407.1 hypothetical protein GE21DRAFT_3648 [Neurospora crassa]|eukprot:XP_011393609.1 bromodomain protein-3 [Neurospora crassa OR74A]
MAVMTSQQADGGAALPEKPVTMATEAPTAAPDAPVADAPKSDAPAADAATADATGDAAPTPDAPVKDVADGDHQKETEVNGHDDAVSPKTLVPETKTDSLPTPKDEPSLEEAQTTPAKKEEDAPKAEESKEGERKSDEQAQKEDAKPAPVEEEKKAEEPAKEEEGPKDEGDKMEIDAPEVPAGDAQKEPVASPGEDKVPEPAAEEKPKEEEKPAAAEEAKEDKPAEPKADVATEAKSEAKSDDGPAAKEKEEAAAPAATETPATEPASKPPASPAKQQEDVEMADAPATVEEPAKSEQAKPAEATPTATQQETQDTAVSDVPPPTPAEDEKKDKESPQPSPAAPVAPVTADTSMSDAPPPSSKPYREREEDSEDEPVAKRAKVSPVADQASAKNEAKREDKMDVDSKPAASSASTSVHDRSEPKSLADDSINHLPISDYMNRQIRQVLAGVKKTKAGYHFRLPVSELWPGLWNEYSAKVKDPTDIQTMEKRLRGNLAKYHTLGDFKRDLEKLVQNSIAFNGEYHDVTAAARSCRDTILARLGGCPAFEPSRPEKKDFAKQHPTRHAEPRAASHLSSPSAPLPQRPQQPRVNTAAVPAPSSSKSIESPAFAIPANNNGMPLIRRDSTKPDSRAKRPVKPTHSKDLVYDTKRKKKLIPELRFCEEVLTELRKQRYYEFNEAFQKPVDPVALNIPTYHKIIKKPMDLSTMQSKLNAGDYASAKEFERDFDLIIKNCRLFNGEQHIVYEQALRLQSLYRREMSKKDEWLAKHAPAPAPHLSSNTSPRLKDESDWEEPESEGEPEVDEELKGAQQRLASYMKRLEEEQKKINDIMLEMNPNMADVEIAQSVVAMLQKQIITERSKIASMQPTKKAAPAKSHHANKPSVSKPKKAMPAGGSSHHAGGHVAKKASVSHSSMGGHGGGMGGMPKKAAARKPAPKRKMGTVEKEVIAAGIAELEGAQLERAIEIIKSDTGTGENDSGELELDIDQLSQEALTQLYDLAIKAFPHLQREKERTMAAQAPAPPPAAQRSKPVQKTKKNKPMSKMEQERRLQQLNELRAQAGRQGSGSQEPLESIEGTGRTSAEPAPQHHREEDSEDEESSEEE